MHGVPEDPRLNGGVDRLDGWMEVEFAFYVSEHDCLIEIEHVSVPLEWRRCCSVHYCFEK